MNRHSARLPLLAAALVSLASAAAAQPAGPIATRSNNVQLRSCIDTSFSPIWRPVNDHTIMVEVGARTFRVTTNQCPTLTAPLPRISTRVRGGSMICSPKDVQLFVSEHGDAAAAPCFVQSIEPLTLEQARAFDRMHRR